MGQKREKLLLILRKVKPHPRRGGGKSHHQQCGDSGGV